MKKAPVRSVISDFKHSASDSSVISQGIGFRFATRRELFDNIADRCFIPQRFDAQLVYTPQGTISYFFNRASTQKKLAELNLSLEICSEAPYSDNNYKSDITFWITDTKRRLFSATATTATGAANSIPNGGQAQIPSTENCSRFRCEWTGCTSTETVLSPKSN